MQRFALMIVLLSGLVACSGPPGAFGVEWGMPADAALEAMGLDCDPWHRLPDMPDYEGCFAESPDIWGHPVDAVTVRRRDGRLAGIDVWFERCDIGAVRRRLIRELGLDPEASEYWSWPNGQIVRLHRRSAGKCLLVITDAEFGKVYAKWLAASSFPNLWH